MNDYFKIQAARISNAETKGKDEIKKINTKSKKRKKKFITNCKRIRDNRNKLNDIEKNKELENDRKRKKNLRDNLNDDEKNKALEKNKKKVKTFREKVHKDICDAFEEAKKINPSDPRILKTKGYKVMDEKFQNNKKKDPLMYVIFV